MTEQSATPTKFQPVLALSKITMFSLALLIEQLFQSKAKLKTWQKKGDGRTN
jgi:hypothetical protein